MALIQILWEHPVPVAVLAIGLALWAACEFVDMIAVDVPDFDEDYSDAA
jgi:hypothetical protein